MWKWGHKLRVEGYEEKLLKKKIKSKKQLVALPRQTLGNKGDLVALKHDCSSEQRKIGMLSM